jgi:hypothetical protein
MKVGIMQPYFLPYIGYFQLMAAVDKFILLDDVNYIKGGWINRNRIFCNGKPSWITIPLLGASPNKLIADIEILPDNGWRRKLTNQIRQSYAGARFCSSTFRHFESWIENAQGSLSVYLYKFLQDISSILDINTEIVPSSSIFPKNRLSGFDRVLDICIQAGATHYINAPGGKFLYDAEVFQNRGIVLEFIEPKIPALPDRVADSGMLSILHLLMHLEPEKLRLTFGK